MPLVVYTMFLNRFRIGIISNFIKCNQEWSALECEGELVTVPEWQGSKAH